MYNPCFICFLLYMNTNTCLIDLIDACLVSRFRSYQQCHQFALYLQTSKVHKISIVKENTPGNLRSENPPCLQNSSSKNALMPSEFQFKEPPVALGIPKSCSWYRYGYFPELANTRASISCRQNVNF